MLDMSWQETGTNGLLDLAGASGLDELEGVVIIKSSDTRGLARNAE